MSRTYDGHPILRSGNIIWGFEKSKDGCNCAEEFDKLRSGQEAILKS